MATVEWIQQKRKDKDSADALCAKNQQVQTLKRNQQVACTSRRKEQHIQSRASMNQLLLCIQSQDVVPVASKLQRYESSRKLLKPTTG
ncbi:hypothetical protein F511_46535 [Dorcoceras hygrometricum]|uniref:Uncharacterized protein n=1 Tax=Dorcoceras hygrometricum TaxID=472368 RepID=A0A2Z7A0N3_9LAMI|nr:hypothetical protein F511_46535 [Dorcoceras hygrometricum]